MMKKYFNITVLVVLLAFLFTGCGPKTTEPPTTAQSTQEIASTTTETSNDNNTQEFTTQEIPEVTETTVPDTATAQTSAEPTQNESEETDTMSTIPQTTTPATTIPVTETPALNTLKISGKVDFEMIATLDELKSLDDIIVEEVFYSKNSFGTTEQTNFKGVNLWYLLKNYAGIDAEASSVTIIAIDGYKMKFTIEQVMKQDYINESEPDKQLPMIIAWEENGTEYNSEDGPPYQLVVGQVAAGDFNKFQWVRNIESIIVD